MASIRSNDRRERLAKALRENLKRRKARNRVRVQDPIVVAREDGPEAANSAIGSERRQNPAAKQV